MNAIAIHSNHYKYMLKTKEIDESNDSFKILLMRQGFVFDPAVHALKKNIKAATGATTLNVNSSLQFTRNSGSFITDGFVVGNQFTTTAFSTGGNNTTKIILSVSATAITVTDTTGLVAESGSGDETLTANDELATANGYTQDTKTLSLIAVTEDNANNRASTTFNTVTWTASGGSIGPTPGAIVYDDTETTKTIIGYLDFGGNQTATTGQPFNVASIEFRGV